jgi:hypothetical protein
VFKKLWKLPHGGNGGKIKDDFPTVSTALGKPSARIATGFPQFSQLLLLEIYR